MPDVPDVMQPEMNDDQWRDAWGVKQKFINAVLKQLELYIEEAEHQDGCQYWTSYETTNFLPDFAIYLQHLEGETNE
jgi:hypothetical protein